MPAECYQEVVNGFETGRKAVEKVMDDNVTLRDLTHVSLDAFDERLKGVIETLTSLLEGDKSIVGEWSPKRILNAFLCGENLASAARMLIERDLYSEVALAVLFRDLKGSRRGDSMLSKKIYPQDNIFGYSENKYNF